VKEWGSCQGKELQDFNSLCKLLPAGFRSSKCVPVKGANNGSGAEAAPSEQLMLQTPRLQTAGRPELVPHTGAAGIVSFHSPAVLWFSKVHEPAGRYYYHQRATEAVKGLGGFSQLYIPS
jgi:hypothetical protein